VQADRTLAMLGTCLVVGLVGLVPSAGSARATAIGSTCAHPWQASFQVGGPNGHFDGDLTLIRMGSALGPIPRSVDWSVRAGYVICSARIQLADGHWVGPTRVNPYPTPTPIGGEYTAPQGPHSPLRTVIVTAARSPVPPGANCNYPLFSGFAVDGATSQKSDTKDFTVKHKLDSENQPREAGEGNSTVEPRSKGQKNNIGDEKHRPLARSAARASTPAALATLTTGHETNTPTAGRKAPARRVVGPRVRKDSVARST
jgi:hypothetical protein